MDSLPVLISVVSDKSVATVHGSGVLLIRDDVSSIGHRSDGLSSPVEGPPLLSVVSVIVLDLEVPLGTSSRVAPDEWSVGSESSSDLELLSISQWVSVVSLSSSLQIESGLMAVSASHEVHDLVVRVRSNLEASVSNSSQVLVG